MSFNAICEKKSRENFRIISIRSEFTVQQSVYFLVARLVLMRVILSSFPNCLRSLAVDDLGGDDSFQVINEYYAKES